MTLKVGDLELLTSVAMSKTVFLVLLSLDIENLTIRKT